MIAPVNRRKGFSALFLVGFSLFTGGVHSSAVLCIEANGRITVEDSADLCCEETSVSASGTPTESEQIIPASEGSSCGSCFDIPLLVGALRPVVQSEKFKVPSFDLTICSLADLNPSVRLNTLTIPFQSEPHAAFTPTIRSTVLRI